MENKVVLLFLDVPRFDLEGVVLLNLKDLDKLNGWISQSYKRINHEAYLNDKDPKKASRSIRKVRYPIKLYLFF